MININSERAKRQAWRYFDRMLRRFEPILFRKSKAYIKQQYKIAASEAEKGIFDLRSIENNSNQLRRTLVAFYKRVASAFGAMILKESEKDDISTRTIFWNHVNRWIEENAGKKITRINNTTRKKIKKIIDDGLQEGLSNRTIAELITAKTNIDSLKRALNIARTETHQTANKGSWEMAKEIQMAYKEWLAAKDDRVRDAHEEANGQRVEIDEPYIVNDEELQFPGDPDGSPENIINCRCTQIYRDEEAKGTRGYRIKQLRFKKIRMIRNRRKYAA